MQEQVQEHHQSVSTLAVLGAILSTEPWRASLPAECLRLMSRGFGHLAELAGPTGSSEDQPIRQRTTPATLQTAHRFEALVGAHGSHSVALHQDVAGGEQLQRFERGSIGPQQPLSSFHEDLLQRVQRRG